MHMNWSIEFKILMFIRYILIILVKIESFSVPFGFKALCIEMGIRVLDELFL